MILLKSNFSKLIFLRKRLHNIKIFFIFLEIFLLKKNTVRRLHDNVAGSLTGL